MTWIQFERERERLHGDIRHHSLLLFEASKTGYRPTLPAGLLLFIPRSLCVVYCKLLTHFLSNSGLSMSSFHDFSVGGISSTPCFQATMDQDTNTAEPVYALRVHNAWHVLWESSDTPSLAPELSVRACPTTTIRAWVPGSFRARLGPRVVQ